MRAHCGAVIAAVLIGTGLIGSDAAYAFGSAGHDIAGAIAEPRLCLSSRAAVARLGRRESLTELGIWADEIRNTPAWEHSGPWHYMNIADGELLADYETPEEGDVLWAIEHFSSRLGDESLTRTERAEALKFLVHFIVDIHQPLHVGRAQDRGGNTISLHVDGETTNLHSLWDSGIIARAPGPRSRYVAEILTLAETNAAQWAAASPRDWAVESKQLREHVYDFDGAPSPDYLNRAGLVVRERLAQAGVRLAAVLNRIFCRPGADEMMR